jgi:hypothetical protein
MSEEEINSQISSKEDEITKVEEASAKAEASAEKEIETEFDPKITDAESKLGIEQGLLDEATEKAAEWKATLAEKKGAVKTLSKEAATLKKDKTKALSTKLKGIASEKKTNIGALNKEIKGLQGQLKALQKAADAEEDAEEE